LAFCARRSANQTRFAELFKLNARSKDDETRSPVSFSWPAGRLRGELGSRRMRQPCHRPTSRGCRRRPLHRLDTAPSRFRLPRPTPTQARRSPAPRFARRLGIGARKRRARSERRTRFDALGRVREHNRLHGSIRRPTSFTFSTRGRCGPRAVGCLRTVAALVVGWGQVRRYRLPLGFQLTPRPGAGLAAPRAPPWQPRGRPGRGRKCTHTGLARRPRKSPWPVGGAPTLPSFMARNTALGPARRAVSMILYQMPGGITCTFSWAYWPTFQAIAAGDAGTADIGRSHRRGMKCRNGGPVSSNDVAAGWAGVISRPAPGRLSRCFFPGFR